MNRTKLFKVFSNDARMKIFQFLLEGKMCVTGMATKLRISQPTVTQHLRILKNAGLVKSVKIGYWMHYSVDRRGLERAKTELKNFLTFLMVKESKCKIHKKECPAKK